MKIMFAYDHRFYSTAEGVVYSKIGFPYEIWKRYIKFVDELVVAARCFPLEEQDDVASMNKSSGNKVSFHAVPNLNSITNKVFIQRRAEQIIEEKLKSLDALIVRLPSEIGMAAVNCAIRLGKPWAVEVAGHAWDACWYFGGWKGKVYAPLANYQMKSIVSKATHSIYVTKNYLQEYFPCSGVTSNCSNVEILESSEKIIINRLNRQLNLRVPLHIGMMGPLQTKYKGLDTALRALSEVRNHVPEFKFRILGGGDSQEWSDLCNKLGIGDRVEFYGSLHSREKVMDWLDDIDLYLQPSLTEGLPRALIEAMSRGCPAIASSAGGIPELLNEYCLHKPGDIKGLGNLLARHMTNSLWLKEQALCNWIMNLNLNTIFF